jgi:transcriptional regulator with PAS, ATPase and Fis domain
MESQEDRVPTHEEVASDAGQTLASSAFLFVVMHCDAPLLGGARYALSSVDEVEVGRGIGRAAIHQQTKSVHKLKISLPGRTVSRSHAWFVRNGASWTLEDNGSRNGILVNGIRVKRASLTDGDDLVIGDVLMRYRSGLDLPVECQNDVDSETMEQALPGLVTLLPAYESKLIALRIAAQSRANILLEGNSGSGKEYLGKALHQVMERSGPFVVVPCAELGIESCERELCGQIKGPLLDTCDDALGYFREADGGTLFIDEVADLPLAGQLVLLRLLETSTVIPLGGSKALPIDVRVIASTQMDLESLVLHGEFHESLWKKLSEYRHALAPLVARIEDLGILIRDILRAPGAEHKKNLKLATQAARTMLRHAWPYNIRELALALELAVGMANGTMITRSKLPIEL